MFLLISLGINYYKYQITDYILYKYTKYNRIKRTNNSIVTQCNVYDKQNLLKGESGDLIDYTTANKMTDNNLGCVVISYNLLGKKYKVIYDSEYNFPPYPYMTKLEYGYKYRFLSAISTIMRLTDVDSTDVDSTDVDPTDVDPTDVDSTEVDSTEVDSTEEVNQLLGPKNNFYIDIGLNMKIKHIFSTKIKCTDNNVNDFIMDDIFYINKPLEIHLELHKD